jgi:hypothetical protein
LTCFIVLIKHESGIIAKFESVSLSPQKALVSLFSWLVEFSRACWTIGLARRKSSKINTYEPTLDMFILKSLHKVLTPLESTLIQNGNGGQPPTRKANRLEVT